MVRQTTLVCSRRGECAASGVPGGRGGGSVLKEQHHPDALVHPRSVDVADRAALGCDARTIAESFRSFNANAKAFREEGDRWEAPAKQGLKP